MHFEGHESAEQERIDTPCVPPPPEQETTIRIRVFPLRRTLYHSTHHPVQPEESRICILVCFSYNGWRR